eukprot:TRINITY_DN67198_c12_g4_i1.p1 TRINITY_DN67198_c12_g4~~TRINITY_DN67198_c12_g4_i1.p1  ORF type:complete len:446 (+),score=35.24 TRINITY_DN67198_c12_g4_i1:161-1498(+)
MSLINISGLTPVEDPSYRYRMPAMVTKIEGKGNGIKTILVNIVELGAALNRDPQEITKFFGCELGAQTSYTTEDAGVAKAIVNGSQTTQAMQNLLKIYIEKFVLCKQCHLPEAHYKIKTGQINYSCKACGAKGPIDMTHKLCTFILKQHTAAKKDEKKKQDKDDKKDKKEHKKDKKDKKDKDDSNKEEKDKEKKKEKKSKKSNNEEEDDGNNSPVNKTSHSNLPPHPPSENSPNSKKETIDDISDLAALDDGIASFKKWLENNTNHTNQMIVDEIRSIARLCSLNTSDRYIILLGGLFTEQATTKNEIEKHKDILQIMLTNKIQCRQLIAAIEWFCGTRCSQLSRYFPVMLKQLYDEDLIEEEVFFEWNLDKVPNDYSVDASITPVNVLEQLKQSAKPFITWLDEAEEEDDEDDDGTLFLSSNFCFACLNESFNDLVSGSKSTAF